MLKSNFRSMTQRSKTLGWFSLRHRKTGPTSVIAYSTAPCLLVTRGYNRRTPIPQVGQERPRVSGRHPKEAGAVRCGRPTGPATTWMVILPRAMAGISGATVNVRDMPLPVISIGVYRCRTGDFLG